MQIELEDEVASDLQRATGAADGDAGDAALTRTLQLTGLSDAVYAEAVVITHQYDVVLDVTVINRTAATMQNVCLELATMGDLKLVERPQNYTLAAGETKRLRANIKVRFCSLFVHAGMLLARGGCRAVRGCGVLRPDALRRPPTLHSVVANAATAWRPALHGGSIGSVPEER